MARIFRVKDLVARKRVLVTESEIYRETLRLEVHNLRLYGAGVKQKLSVFRLSGPLVMLAPLAAGLFGIPLGRAAVRRRRRKWLRLGLTSVLGWQMYRKLAPFLGTFLAQQMARKEESTDTGAPAEEKAPAANI